MRMIFKRIEAWCNEAHSYPAHIHIMMTTNAASNHGENMEVCRPSTYEGHWGMRTFDMLGSWLRDESNQAEGDEVRRVDDGLLQVKWPDACYMDVKRESLASRNITVEIAVGPAVAAWLMDRDGVFSVVDAGGWDYECWFCNRVRLSHSRSGDDRASRAAESVLAAAPST